MHGKGIFKDSISNEEKDIQFENGTIKMYWFHSNKATSLLYNN